MGAEVFMDVGRGKTVEKAFNQLVEDARYENGHGGYTGTIAEKTDYKSATSKVFESKQEAFDFAEKLMEDGNHWSDDKWGPAAYVSFKDNKGEICYLFFGWASS